MPAAPGAPVQLVLAALKVPAPPFTVPLPTRSAPSQNCTSCPPFRSSRFTWCGMLVVTVAPDGVAAKAPEVVPETLNSR